MSAETMRKGTKGDKMGKLQNIGNVIFFGVKLQLYFLYCVVRGGVIFGIFPGFLFLYRTIASCFEEKMISHVDLKKEVRRLETIEIVKINVISYLMIGFLWLLGINLQIARTLIASPAVHFLTLLLLATTLSTGLYILPILSKYELPIKQYFLQAFLLGLISIFDTIAIFIGMSIAFAIGLVIPPLGFFAGMPLLFLPYVWFSRASIRRLERVLYKEIDYIGVHSAETEK